MRLRHQFALSSAPQTIQRATRLLALAAEATDVDKDTLTGCAMILSAIALDQAITTHLKQLSDFYHTVDDAHPQNPAEKLRNESFKRRLLRTPEIGTLYPSRLDTESPDVQRLMTLVKLRNNMMHHAEEPICFDIDVATEVMPVTSRVTFDPSRPSGLATMEGDVLVVNVNLSDAAQAVAGNPWGHVTLEEATKTVSAVETYVDKVLWDPGPCDMLTPMADQ